MNSLFINKSSSPCSNLSLRINSFIFEKQIGFFNATLILITSLFITYFNKTQKISLIINESLFKSLSLCYYPIECLEFITSLFDLLILSAEFLNQLFIILYFSMKFDCLLIRSDNLL